MNTEIFRFTAVRTPQQANSNKKSENTLNLFNSREDGDFLKALREARKISLERLIAIALGFSMSNEYVKSIIDVPASFSDFNDSLSTNTGELAVSKIEELIKKHFRFGAKELIGTEIFKVTRQKVANSILASLILKNSAPQSQNIQARLLRVIGLIEKTAVIKEDKVNLFDLLSTSFILPKDIFPLPVDSNNLEDGIKKQKEEEEQVKKEKEEEQKKLIEEIEELKSTFSELQESMEVEKTRINSSDNSTSKVTEKGFYLDAASANKLSQKAKSVVGKLNFDLDRLDASILLPKIENKISKLSQNLYQEIPFNSKVYKIGNSFLVDEKSGACSSKIVPTTTDQSEPFVPNSYGKARVLGIMDLLLVEQNLLHYEKGEIAHIENVMVGEIRERKHRRMLTREESTFTETEVTEEKEQDLTSTERYELQVESQKVIEESRSFDAGVTANVYGVSYDVSAQANIAGSTSESETNSSSSTFARDITTKAVSKITNRTLERRFKRTVEEIEENNLHSFNNTSGEEHIVGVYRWLDKIYEAQVVRYGKRLMLEFIVPEPASFYRFAVQQQPTENITLTKPEQPGYCVGGKLFRPLKAKDITRENYLLWANIYNASNITPPPPTYQVVGESFATPENIKKEELYYHSEKGKISIPNGYYPEIAKVNRDLIGLNQIISTGAVPILTVQIEDMDLTQKGSSTVYLSKFSTESLPITITSGNIINFGITITVFCKLSDAKFEEWQLKTFNAIMEAYNDQKARFESQLETDRIRQGFGNINGKNPLFNRETERTELKKGCITLLTAQRFELFNAVLKNVRNDKGKYGYPEIVNFDDAHAEGSYIQFFEQAIEWSNMLYVLYPYYWAEKSQWVQLSQLNDDDALFTKFLQSGSARVQIPIRPGFEFAILTYLQTGLLWQAEGNFIDVNEDGMPDELQVSILDELKEGVLKPDDNSAGKPVGEPWKVRVPTNLVIIGNEANNFIK